MDTRYAKLEGGRPRRYSRNDVQASICTLDALLLFPVCCNKFVNPPFDNQTLSIKRRWWARLVEQLGRITQSMSANCQFVAPSQPIRSKKWPRAGMQAHQTRTLILWCSIAIYVHKTTRTTPTTQSYDRTEFGQAE